MKKMWTNHERQAAQNRALSDRDSEYLLPIRIDGTTLSGMPDSVAYINIAEVHKNIVMLIARKLGSRLSQLP